MKLELLNQELKHCREMLEQKDKEIELLRQLAASVQNKSLGRLKNDFQTALLYLKEYEIRLDSSFTI